ncbi:hypothetical protein BH10ACT1_BH10ACT1_42180 [soil metagenome]
MTSPVRAPRATPRGVPIQPLGDPRPDLRVVRAPARRSRTGMWFGLSVVLVFGALLVAAVAHSLLVGGQAHLDQVNRDIRTEKQLLEREQLQLAERQSPVRIAKEAEALGMVDGGAQQWMSPTSPSGPVDTGRTGSGSAAPEGDAGSSSELASGSDGGATSQP